MHGLRVFEGLFDGHCIAIDIGSHCYGLAAEVCGVALLTVSVVHPKSRRNEVTVLV